MKKGGIINAKLIGEITKLRHRDQFVICDVGLPLPENANVVDISLVPGIPSFMQTLTAVLNEIVVEEAIAQEPIQKYNEELNIKIKSLLSKQKFRYLGNEDFVEVAKDSKLFIRTAEYLPFSNLILYSASGVPFIAEKFDIVCEEIK